MTKARKQEMAFLRPVVEAQPINLIVLGDQSGTGLAELGDVERAPREQCLSSFLLQREILGANPQCRQFRFCRYRMQPHERLVLLDNLPRLNEDLLDDSSLQML